MIPIIGSNIQVIIQVGINQDDIEGIGILPNRSLCKRGYCPDPNDVDTRSTAAIVIQAIYVCIIILLSSAGNLLVLLAIYRNKNLQNKTSIFVANLAIADFTNGFVAMPLVLVCTITYKWPFTEAMCSFLAFLIILLCTVSMGTLGAIAHDRYNAIVHPLKYHNRMSKSKIYFFVCWIWIQSMIISVCPLLGWSEYIYIRNEYLCTANWGYEISYTITLSVICFLVPFIVMVYSYVRIFIVARRHSRQITALTAFLQCHQNNHRDTTSERNNNPRSSLFRGSTKRHFKKDAKSAFMLLVVIGAFVACWVPHGVTMYSFIIDSMDDDLPDFVYTTTTLLAMSNSMLNPILYGLLNRPYRRAFKKILCSRSTRIQNRQSTETHSDNARRLQRRTTDDTEDTIPSREQPLPEDEPTSRGNVFLVTSHSAVFEEDTSVAVAPMEVSDSGDPSNTRGVCLSEMVTHTIRITHTISALVNAESSEANQFNDLI
ncbi:histamine H2 receptor-like [Amphiura filiformis]|uniref:histamine H2 receptor-like n=1 Tax=Amphiura filiformis TaxID=82378 RepID=UPI003B228AEA